MKHLSREGHIAYPGEMHKMVTKDTKETKEEPLKDEAKEDQKAAEEQKAAEANQAAIVAAQEAGAKAALKEGNVYFVYDRDTVLTAEVIGKAKPPNTIHLRVEGVAPQTFTTTVSTPPATKEFLNVRHGSKTEVGTYYTPEDIGELPTPAPK